MRRLLLHVIAGGLALVAAIALGIYLYERPTVLRVAVTRDSDDLKIMAAAATQFVHEKDNIHLKLVPVETPAASAKLLDEGDADLAVVRSDIAIPVHGQTVLIMRKSAVVFLAPFGSALHSVGDLENRRIAVIHATHGGGEGNIRLLDTILAQYDLAADKVQKRLLSTAELPKALENKEVDAVFAVGIPSIGHLADAVATVAQVGHGQPVFFPISEATALAQRFPAFEATQIVRGAFGGAQPKPAKEFETLGVSTLLVAHNSLRNSTVGDLTRLMLAARPAIAHKVPVANRIEAPNTDKGAALPVHPGAAAYLDDEEETFFDKYSDFVYIGAMVLSLLGSGLAALASRMRTTNDEISDELLNRLTEIFKEARVAKSAAELDLLEEETDELLISALRSDNRRSMDGVRLGALGIALQQARHAIAEKRRELLTSGRVVAFNAPRVQDSR
jgi:TRAP transporter TAXI family solute receptor